MPLLDAYPLLLTIDGNAAVARNEGRRAGVREADSARAAGRKSLEAIVMADRVVEIKERGGLGFIVAGEGDGVVDGGNEISLDC